MGLHLQGMATWSLATTVPVLHGDLRASSSPLCLVDVSLQAEGELKKTQILKRKISSSYS